MIFSFLCKKSPQKFDKIWCLEYNWVSNFIILYDQMKQKRKVKSLIPQNKDWHGSFLTTLLLVLSVILCIWSVSLMTMSIWVSAWNTDDNNFLYTWLYEKSEVLYNMKFVDSSNLTNNVANTYISWKSLYIVPSPVIVNPLVCYGGYGDSCSINHSINEVMGDVYGHVLWWYKNKVNSDNVTLIAWEDNVVTEWNDNAAFLWWQSNTGFGTMKALGTPMVVVWWSNNTVWENHDGVALIWWKRNKIGDEVSDSFILWWEDNEIGNGRTNVIVWWKNVNVSGTDNVFVFSVDNQFIPKSSNAFYLNLYNGVWIGVDAPWKRWWLAVKGAVSLWEIDIVHLQCIDENLWVKWSYKGCVVWCTIAWKNAGWKWEVLDRGEKCMDICKNQSNGRCIYEEDDDNLELVPDYTWYCTALPDSYKTGIEPCFDVTVYKNVVFESSLVDNWACPEDQENRCVFSCKDGYHLTGDKTNPGSINYDNSIRCYSDCKLPWKDANGKDIFIKQNETRIWYKNQNVWCAYDDPKFPASVFTCAWEKKNLVCYDGNLYELKDGKRTTADVTEYKYKTCRLGNYSCNISKYNLSRDEVISGKTGKYGINKEVISNWNVQDRSTNPGIVWTRWKYSRCIDFTAGNPNNDIPGNETCNTGTNHYHLLSCNTHYTTWESHPYECLSQCSLKWRYGIDVWYNHGTTVLWYKDLNPKCPEECESVELTCNDGNWEWGNANDYWFNTCTTIPEPCEGYNISAEIYNLYNHVSWTESRNSIYEACHRYSSPSQVDCEDANVVYKLVDCKPGYHAEGDHCVINVKVNSCDFYPGYAKPNGSHYTRDAGYVDYNWGSRWVEKWDFLENWTCGWSGSANCWESPVPSNACDWECDETYRPEWNSCVRDWKCSKTEPFACEESGKIEHVHEDNLFDDTSDTFEDEYGYYWQCLWDGWNADDCHICKDGNSWDGDVYRGSVKGTCVKNQDGECLNEMGLLNSSPRGKCAPLDLMLSWSYRWPNWRPFNFSSSSSPIMFTWNCKWSGTWATAYDCHQCFTHYTWDSQDQVCKPDSRTNSCINMSMDNPYKDKPAYSEWVGNNYYIQTWEGNWHNGGWEWIPTILDSPIVHDPSWNARCAFMCIDDRETTTNWHFEWNEERYQCEPRVITYLCPAKPANSKWTNADEDEVYMPYQTTWNQERGWYLPYYISPTYDPSWVEDCAFECLENFHYDEYSDSCVPNTNSESCGDLDDYGITHATWVNNMFEQIWDWSWWNPVSAPDPICVNDNSSAEECSFMCDQGYECNDDRTGCVWIDDRTCTDYTEYLKCEDWTDWTAVEVSNPDANHLYWQCGDTMCKTCDSANGYKYLAGRWCIRCNNCASSGFPYCLPIDFRDGCVESDWTDLSWWW